MVLIVPLSFPALVDFLLVPLSKEFVEFLEWGEKTVQKFPKSTITNNFEGFTGELPQDDSEYLHPLASEIFSKEDEYKFTFSEYLNTHFTIDNFSQNQRTTAVIIKNDEEWYLYFEVDSWRYSHTTNPETRLIKIDIEEIKTYIEASTMKLL